MLNANMCAIDQGTSLRHFFSDSVLLPKMISALTISSSYIRLSEYKLVD